MIVKVTASAGVHLTEIHRHKSVVSSNARRNGPDRFEQTERSGALEKIEAEPNAQDAANTPNNASASMFRVHSAARRVICAKPCRLLSCLSSMLQHTGPRAARWSGLT
ncbi:hypothetical protein IVB12_17115 [Bradyrhizobium sp. 179]|uniref:hypothetical protein n=1 Tax=Bradyrhizobium sp. 179 TaxID=2782648 RepID=UPI001FFA4EE2|nr:hypothetical protein [Bradyrhizobium sp. 179]MCK1543633.1 hypothetical protein [Bradyrhizobium sp. 179]